MYISNTHYLERDVSRTRCHRYLLHAPVPAHGADRLAPQTLIVLHRRVQTFVHVILQLKHSTGHVQIRILHGLMLHEW